MALALANSLCIVGELKHELETLESLLEGPMKVESQHLLAKLDSVVESINLLLSNIENGPMDSVRAIESYQSLLCSKIPLVTCMWECMWVVRERDSNSMSLLPLTDRVRVVGNETSLVVKNKIRLKFMPETDDSTVRLKLIKNRKNSPIFEIPSQNLLAFVVDSLRATPTPTQQSPTSAPIPTQTVLDDIPVKTEMMNGVAEAEGFSNALVKVDPWEKNSAQSESEFPNGKDALIDLDEANNHVVAVPTNSRQRGPRRGSAPDDVDDVDDDDGDYEPEESSAFELEFFQDPPSVAGISQQPGNDESLPDSTNSAIDSALPNSPSPDFESAEESDDSYVEPKKRRRGRRKGVGKKADSQTESQRAEVKQRRKRGPRKSKLSGDEKPAAASELFCRICSLKVGSTAQRQRKHMTDVHNVLNFECCICPKTLSSLEDLTTHVKITHGYYK